MEFGGSVAGAGADADGAFEADAYAEATEEAN